MDEDLLFAQGAPGLGSVFQVQYLLMSAAHTALVSTMDLILFSCARNYVAMLVRCIPALNDCSVILMIHVIDGPVYLRSHINSSHLFHCFLHYSVHLSIQASVFGKLQNSATDCFSISPWLVL